MEIVPIARALVFVIFVDNIWMNYRNLFSIIDQEKKVAYLDSIIHIILSVLAFLSMYFWGFSGLIISRVIGYSFGAIFYYLTGQFLVKQVKVSLRNIFPHLLGLLLCIYFTFELNMILAQIIITPKTEDFLLSIVKMIIPSNWEIRGQIVLLMNSMLNIILFLLLYCVFIILGGLLTKRDISYLEKLPIKFPLKKKVLKIAKKILRS